MVELTLEVVALVGATLGVASHLGYFIHGEHHMQTTKITALFVIAPLLLFVTFSRYIVDDSHNEAAKCTVVATGCYFTALSTSILIYRAFFHPLCNFPGPFVARLSKFVHVLWIAKSSKNYLLQEELFEKYGEFVRYD
jgi:cytochrome P450 family 628